MHFNNNNFKNKVYKCNANYKNVVSFYIKDFILCLTNFLLRSKLLKLFMEILYNIHKFMLMLKGSYLILPNLVFYLIILKTLFIFWQVE